jgi:hypothetical protein
MRQNRGQGFIKSTTTCLFINKAILLAHGLPISYERTRLRWTPIICDAMFELRSYSPRLHWRTKRPERTSRAHLIKRTDGRSTDASLV